MGIFSIGHSVPHLEKSAAQCASAPWVEEQQRFFQSLQAFDSYLASDGDLHGSIDALMQGPLPTRLPMLASWPCCAVSSAAQPVEKTSTLPPSQSAAPAPTSHRQSNPSSSHQTPDPGSLLSCAQQLNRLPVR